ncbi:AMP-dependent synthetase [Acidobacteria bacterium AB60]|nr:AMP-dependent synthetase [Acidobacteria bacterium AB60]
MEAVLPTQPCLGLGSFDRSTNLADYLLGGKDPMSVALLTLESAFTYGELDLVSTQLADHLVAVGAQKGDRAILLSENGFFWVAAYLACLRAGMVCVPLPPNIPEKDLAFVAQQTDARFAFAQTRVVRAFPRLSSLTTVTDSELSVSSCRTSITSQASARAVPGLRAPVAGWDDLAALMFTSGSTGTPRGVMVTHGNIIANTESVIEYLRLTAQDRIMTVLPFHYCFGTSLLHTHLRVGGTLVIDRRFMFPEKVLQRMVETECTGFAGVPSHFQILLRRSGLAKMRFPHLRYVQQAGGHLAPTFIRELRKALPTSAVFVMYGQTEATARLAYLPPEMLDQKLGSIGKAIPGVQLEVVDESGRPVAPGGQIGEIVARGENIALGYWRAEEESAATFRAGALHTGDLATVDEEGFIYIVDRAKDFIKCGGKRTSCRRLEEAMLECPDLLEAAVVGIPDEVLGEAVKAFVVHRDKKADGLETRFAAFCRERLPINWIPKEIVVLESLPKNSAGKVVKSSLRRLCGGN